MITDSRTGWKWADCDRGLLSDHALYATGVGRGLLRDELGLHVTGGKGGPFGGDQQIGALFADCP